METHAGKPARKKVKDLTLAEFAALCGHCQTCPTEGRICERRSPRYWPGADCWQWEIELPAGENQGSTD
ncbi:MAG: hypothetical protein LBK56_13565 [Gracilibacteraceae bacterium]|jgi:hypothetical protein|nr:hypothetical protein [Gracilibacteraceae bacterium]